MRLYEYEGKTLFKKAGIRVPKSLVVEKDAPLPSLENGAWPGW